MKNFLKLLQRLFRPTYLRLTVILVFLNLILVIWEPPLLHNLELKLYDLLFQLRGPEPVGPEVVIIAIDDASLKALGRWPWSRQQIAQLLERLQEAGARVIGFDVIFAEKEESQGLTVVTELERRFRSLVDYHGELRAWLGRQKQLLDPDGDLAARLQESGRVVLGYYFQGLESVRLPLSALHLAVAPELIKSSSYDVVRWTKAPPDGYPLLMAQGVEINLPRLTAAAADTGYFNVLPDPDGTIRSLPLVVRYQNDLYAPLPLALLQLYLDNPLLQIILGPEGVQEIRLGQQQIPVDRWGRFRINYRGPAKSFPYYSYAEVLAGRVAPEVFRDRIVLVGATAVGIYDVRVTPFSSVFPGVEIHATIIDNLLRQDFLHAPRGLVNPAVLMLVGGSLLLGLLLPRLRPGFGLALLLVLVGGYLLLDYYLFKYWRLYLQILYPLNCLLLVYVGVAFLRFLAEERERLRIKAAFQNYVAPEVVNLMLQHPERLRLGGERRELTVLFSDIRGFTSLSEQMDPEELVSLLHSYLNPMTDLVFQYRGTMDKYIGDAIMALYGAPLPLPDHADRACETAVAMVARLQELWPEWQARGWPPLQIGIGINSGLVTVGNMGSARLFDYTAIGDHVNLASRLEGLNKYYGTTILISEYTRVLLQREFILREVDRVRVKGKKEAVAILEVRGLGHPAGKEAEFLARFAAGLLAYRRQQWDIAARHFSDCLRLVPEDGPAKLLLARCDTYRRQPPPPQWDGVHILTEK